MMKAYTDIEQSKKLAEILPVEGADMCYRAYREEDEIPDYQVTLCPYQLASWIGVPCWSLAALLKILPEGTDLHKAIDETMECYYVEVYNNRKYFSTEVLYDNPIDACYEIILKLKEKDLL